MKGDFVGFTFDGIHSDEMGITRVSNGDRYDEDILPEIDNKTVEIPGNDGEYYFGSWYKNKEINIEVAFNSLTETQYQNLRRIFSTKKLKPLIFDEAPYKTYWVRAASAPQFHTVCFDNLTPLDSSDIIKLKEKWPVLDGTPSGERDVMIPRYSKKRNYKGEGTISFISFYPFGRCEKKFLNRYDNINKEEWAESSGLLLDKTFREEITEDGEQKTITLNIDTFEDGVAKLYNPGHLEAPFKIYIPFQGNTGKQIHFTIESLTRNIYIDNLQKNDNDRIDENRGTTGVFINTQNHLIEGVRKNSDNSFITSGFVYNEYIEGGDFFKIPLTPRPVDNSIEAINNCVISLETNAVNAEIFYDYLYY